MKGGDINEDIFEFKKLTNFYQKGDEFSGIFIVRYNTLENGV